MLVKFLAINEFYKCIRKFPTSRNSFQNDSTIGKELIKIINYATFSSSFDRQTFTSQKSIRNTCESSNHLREPLLNLDAILAEILVTFHLVAVRCVTGENWAGINASLDSIEYSCVQKNSKLKRYWLVLKCLRRGISPIVYLMVVDIAST